LKDLKCVRTSDLRVVYTDADHTLYADSPDLFPVADAPANHRHLGPVVWSPPCATHPWWHDVPDDRPVIYLTMGSSGSQRVLELVIDSLAGMDSSIIGSTAGAALPVGRWRNVWLADYLPAQAIRAAVEAGLYPALKGTASRHSQTPSVPLAHRFQAFLNDVGLG